MTHVTSKRGIAKKQGILARLQATYDDSSAAKHGTDPRFAITSSSNRQDLRKGILPINHRLYRFWENDRAR